MPLSMKIIASVLTLAGLARFAWTVQREGSQEALERLFPNIDPSIVRKVHQEMTSEALRGKFKHVDIDDEDVMMKIFYEKAEKYLEK